MWVAKGDQPSAAGILCEQVTEAAASPQQVPSLLLIWCSWSAEGEEIEHEVIQRCGGAGDAPSVHV